MDYSRIGFLDVGYRGPGAILNLLQKGFKVVVWNMLGCECADLVQAGATLASTPAEVIRTCDVTFAMLGEPENASLVAFQEDGVVKSISQGKGYIDCTPVDEQRSQKIADAITKAGGRFLEAPACGSVTRAGEAELVFLAAGDRSLFNDARPALEAMGKKSLFLGPVGTGARMKLINNVIAASMVSALAEGMALAAAADLETAQVLEVLNAGAMSSALFRRKGADMQTFHVQVEGELVHFLGIPKGAFPPSIPLRLIHNDTSRALALAEQLGLPLPTIAACHENFQKAIDKGLGDQDYAAVHTVLRRS